MIQPWGAMGPRPTLFFAVGTAGACLVRFFLIFFIYILFRQILGLSEQALFSAPPLFFIFWVNSGLRLVLAVAFVVNKEWEKRSSFSIYISQAWIRISGLKYVGLKYVLKKKKRNWIRISGLKYVGLTYVMKKGVEKKNEKKKEKRN